MMSRRTSERRSRPIERPLPGRNLHPATAMAPQAVPLARPCDDAPTGDCFLTRCTADHCRELLLPNPLPQTTLLPHRATNRLGVRAPAPIPASYCRQSTLLLSRADIGKRTDLKLSQAIQT